MCTVLHQIAERGHLVHLLETDTWCRIMQGWKVIRQLFLLQRKSERFSCFQPRNILFPALAQNPQSSARARSLARSRTHAHTHWSTLIWITVYTAGRQPFGWMAPAFRRRGHTNRIRSGSGGKCEVEVEVGESINRIV